MAKRTSRVEGTRLVLAGYGACMWVVVPGVAVVVVPGGGVGGGPGGGVGGATAGWGPRGWRWCLPSLGSAPLGPPASALRASIGDTLGPPKQCFLARIAKTSLLPERYTMVWPESPKHLKVVEKVVP